MNKEKFICDNGKIRDCNSNIAKMNVLEFLIFKRFYIYQISVAMGECLKIILEGIKAFGFLLINIVLTLFFPIVFPILAYKEIQRVKRDVSQRTKYK